MIADNALEAGALDALYAKYRKVIESSLTLETAVALGGGSGDDGEDQRSLIGQGMGTPNPSGSPLIVG